MKTLTEDEFDNTYHLLKNRLVDVCSFNGCMFETYGKELDFIIEMVNVNPKNIWTIVTDDYSDLNIISGYHIVNKHGYLITMEDWEEDTEVILDKF